MNVRTPERDVFGHTADGEPVLRLAISGGGLTASVLTWGAVIQDLRLAGHAPPLVLGFETFDPYPVHSPAFGATPGRCANRIADGRYTLDGVEVHLERNEQGRTHLHGGSDNLAVRNWTLLDLASDRVTLGIRDPAGRAGYPGTCTVSATYHLRDAGTLSVTYEATTDAACPVNLCQHSYFNLDGRADTLDHELRIAADHFLPTTPHQTPTGEVRAVAGTPFDFREPAPMRRHSDAGQVLFDHNFCLSAARGPKRSVALARSPHSGVCLEVRTTEPGVQFYAAPGLRVPVPGLEGRAYGPFAGFCLETQAWPDAVNHPGFPSAILRPGEVLRQETDYVFTRK
ncbi:MAG: galactose mutarotase [Rhizobiales bacterium]|nr:galactose mutarotase [Hyphomicrobiales bacterium]